MFLGLLSNIYSLQVIDRESSLVTVNMQTLDTYYIPTPRGEIYDTNNVKLVSSSLEPLSLIHI